MDENLKSPLLIADDVIIGAGACVIKSISCGTWGGCRPSPFEGENDGKIGREEDQPVGADGITGCGNTELLLPADRFSNWQYPVIEDGGLTKYHWLVQHKDKLQLGYMTDIGAFTYINAKHGVTIGDFVQIGSHCSIYSVSTIDDKTGPVVLKKNCKVGSHSTIMPGVTVGENAVVGAHSFVNRDVTDDAVVADVPAKSLTQRR